MCPRMTRVYCGTDRGNASRSDNSRQKLHQWGGRSPVAARRQHRGSNPSRCKMSGGRRRRDARPATRESRSRRQRCKPGWRARSRPKARRPISRARRGSPPRPVLPLNDEAWCGWGRGPRSAPAGSRPKRHRASRPGRPRPKRCHCPEPAARPRGRACIHRRVAAPLRRQATTRPQPGAPPTHAGPPAPAASGPGFPNRAPPIRGRGRGDRPGMASPSPPMPPR